MADSDAPTTEELETLALLGAALEVGDPVPDLAVAMAKTVPEWANLDGELAALLEDSGMAVAVAGVRSGDSAIRSVTFEAESLAVEVQVSAAAGHGMVDIGGLVAPAGPGQVQLHQRDGTLVATIDELGRFTLAGVTSGMTWIEVEVGPDRVHTSWFLL